MVVDGMVMVAVTVVTVKVVTFEVMNGTVAGVMVVVEAV